MFDPVRSYDKPGVIIAQLANGIATTDSVRRVLFDPAALSPRERESVADKLKAQFGNNAVIDTAIDVMANPIVWMGMLVAGGAAPGAVNVMEGRRFFGGGGGPGAYFKTMFPFARAIHGTSGMTESWGRRIAGLAQVSGHHLDRVQKDLAGIMEPEVNSVLKTLSEKHRQKITSLNPDAAPNEAIAHDLRLIRAVLEIRKQGLHLDRETEALAGVAPERYHIRVTREENRKSKTRAVQVTEDLFYKLHDLFQQTRDGKYRQELNLAENTELLREMNSPTAGMNMLDYMTERKLDKVVFRLGLKGELTRNVMDRNDPSLSVASLVEGGVKVKWSPKLRKKWIRNLNEVERVETELGLAGLVRAQEQMYERSRMHLVGDEAHYAETGRFRFDNGKLLRLASSQVQMLIDNKLMTSGGNIELGGSEAIRALLSDEVGGRLLRAAERSEGKRIRMGATRAEIEKVVAEAYRKGFEDPYYMPRNTLEMRDRGNKRVAFNPFDVNAPTSGGVSGVEFGMSASGRTIARGQRTNVPYAPEDLEFIRRYFGGTTHLEKLIRHANRRVQGQLENSNQYRVMRIAPDLAASKYIASTARDYALHSMDAVADPRIRAIMLDYGPGGGSKARMTGPLGSSQAGVSAGVSRLEEIPAEMRPVGGFSLAQLMDADLRAVQAAQPNEKFSIGLWRNHILPTMFGVKPMDDAAQAVASATIRESALRLANSRFMKTVERMGGVPARFVQEMRMWGNDPMADPNQPWGAATRLLYSSHLGLNMGSAIINLLQPLQTVHQYGMKASAKAYWQSLNMVGNYALERMKLGGGASQAEVEEMRQRVFSRTFGRGRVSLVDVSDIGQTWNMIEKAGFGVRPTVGKPSFKLLEMMMIPFQTAETVNRVMTSNAVLNLYEKAGRTAGLDFHRAMLDAESAVQQFQFGGSPINRPSAFFQPFLRRPEFRQFAQYGFRSLVNLFTLPSMMGDERMVLGKPVRNRFGITLVDLTKMAAVSAVTYEIFKNMLGADISRGLAFGGPVDLVGGSSALTQKNFPMYIPPIVDVGWDAARYLATGDSEILQDWVPRAIPGGVAVSRALGALPESAPLQALGLQKTYADWRQSGSGMVPVYDSDQRFMGQYPTSDVVLRAFGADLGRFQQPQELSQFILKNREQIREGRRQFIAAVLGNNMSAAKQVKARFEKQFGLPLTVTQAQFKEAMKVREKSIVARELESVDQTMRGQYAQAVQQYMPGLLMPGPATVVQQGDMYRWGNR